MKNIIKITLLALLVAIPIAILAIPSSADLNIPEVDNHFLKDAKTAEYYELAEENGQIVYRRANLYEKEVARRSQPLNEYFVDQLVKDGMALSHARKFTVGNYEDYILSLPMDEDYIPLMKHHGVPKEQYSNWTNMDAENFLYEKNKHLYKCGRVYTDEQIAMVNQKGITYNEFKTLNNLGYEIEEVVELTSQELDYILAR